MSNEPKQRLDPNVPFLVHAFALPNNRTEYAVQQGIERNILLKTWGGLGDQICAEPTLRFALKKFTSCDVSLASQQPELFAHLNFKDVFNLNREQPLWERYFPFETIRPIQDIQWQFMSHMLINCVDYPSLCAFRCQLPVEDKVVVLEPTPADFSVAWAAISGITEGPCVAIHAGRHWQSKTFPKAWWDTVICAVIEGGAIPVLIGYDTNEAGDNRGTVDVNTLGCVDLRGRLSIMESVALLQSVAVLLTNDSAPLHMAVTGRAWIGYVATCKHPDYISHWRLSSPGGAPVWSWRMQNHGKGGVWDVFDYCPNKAQAIEAENVGDELLDSWLPNATDFGAWGAAKAKRSEAANA